MSTEHGESRAALNEALAGLQRGTYVAPSRQTVGAFLEMWIEGARTELALTAWVNYGDSIRRYIAPHLGSKRLVDLSPLDVKVWHAALLDHGRADGGGLAVASVQLSHRVLHRALADAVRWKLISTNPVSGTRVPRGERKEMRTWTADEATRFLDGIAGDRLVALWTLALHTGLRRGELAGLRWKDVDLDDCTLTVAQQRTNANHEIVVSTPKGEEPTPAGARPGNCRRPPPAPGGTAA